VAGTTETTTGFGWVMTAPGEPMERRSTAVVRPGPGEALVRVAGCGVCHTDLGFLYDGVKPRAALPLVLGHEISGEVVAAGPGHEHLVGRPVIVPAVTPCGECAVCRAGHGTLCAAQCMPGNDVPGGFASHVTVPARGLCLVDELGASLGEVLERCGCTLAELAVVADAVTTPFQALTRARVARGDLVVVVGLGGVGGFAAQIAHALGATTVGFEVRKERLELLEQHGLDVGLDPSGCDPRSLRESVRSVAAAHDLPATRWKIFECSGSAAGQELAWSLLGPGAYLSIVGYTREKVALRLSNLMAFDAKAVGNWGCLPELYPAALKLVVDGDVSLARFVQTFPMDEIQNVMEDLRDHRTLRRPVLVP